MAKAQAQESGQGRLPSVARLRPGRKAAERGLEIGQVTP
jgi:hypothetical protein